MHNYYYIPQNTLNTNTFAAIQQATGANIVNVVPIKINYSIVKDQSGNFTTNQEMYYEIEYYFTEEYRSQMLAIEGCMFFEESSGARSFKENGFLNAN